MADNPKLTPESRHWMPEWPRELVPNRMQLAVDFLKIMGILTKDEAEMAHWRIEEFAKREYTKGEQPPLRRALLKIPGYEHLLNRENK